MSFFNVLILHYAPIGISSSSSMTPPLLFLQTISSKVALTLYFFLLYSLFFIHKSPLMIEIPSLIVAQLKSSIRTPSHSSIVVLPPSSIPSPFPSSILVPLLSSTAVPLYSSISTQPPSSTTIPPLSFEQSYLNHL